MMLKKIGFALLRMGLMLVAGLAIYLWFFEYRFIFYPERTLAGKPHHRHEDIRFAAIDGTPLHGWFIPFDGSKRVFIISHGNAGNIGDRVDYTEFVLSEFRENVLAYDYRGYGQSDGKPSEEGTYSDLRGAIRYVQTRGFQSNQIFLIGQSLGCAVTIGVAYQEPVAGIILEAPFTSIRDMAKHYAFSIPIGYAFRTRYDSLSRVPSLHVPIVVVQGTRDPIIPSEFGRRIFAAATAPKLFFPVNAEIHEGALMALGIQDISRIRRFLVPCDSPPCG